MVEGLLQINLDPPYIAFESRDNTHSFNSCTIEDIRALLIDLEAIAPGQHWPLREFTMRLAGEFADETLQKFGLIKPLLIEPNFRSKHQLTSLKAG